MQSVSSLLTPPQAPAGEQAETPGSRFATESRELYTSDRTAELLDKYVSQLDTVFASAGEDTGAGGVEWGWGSSSTVGHAQSAPCSRTPLAPVPPLALLPSLTRQSRERAGHPVPPGSTHRPFQPPASAARSHQAGRRPRSRRAWAGGWTWGQRAARVMHPIPAPLPLASGPCADPFLLPSLPIQTYHRVAATCRCGCRP